MAFTIISLALLVVVGLAVSGMAMGAGDDCPPPSDGGNNEVYTPPEDEGNNEEPEAPQNEETVEDDGGMLGSLGSMSSSQLTIGVLAVVGVIVGAVYFFFAMRMDEDIIE